MSCLEAALLERSVLRDFNRGVQMPQLPGDGLHMLPDYRRVISEADVRAARAKPHGTGRVPTITLLYLEGYLRALRTSLSSLAGLRHEAERPD
jgi:hypothetical protein